MPTYVYKFVATGETIEIQQRFDDDALTELEHPETGATMEVKKVFLPVGVTFKGSGFFKTDNRGSTGRSSRSSGADAGSSGGSSSSGSSSSSDSSTAGSSTTASSPTTGSTSGTSSSD